MPDIIILFFLLGVAAGILRSDISLPRGLYHTLTILLLLTIGLKGGVELAQVELTSVLPKAAAIIVFGITLPLLAYPILLHLGRLPRADAASIAAHYGSVSVGTYAVGVAFLEVLNVPYESYLPLFVVLLEMPAIGVGILLARGGLRGLPVGKLAHEVFLNKGIVLMGGGLLIGWAAGPEGVTKVEPFFFDLFYGILALFLVEMGLLAASQLSDLRKNGLFLAAFGIIMPLIFALAGILLAGLMGMSVGGAFLMAVLGASASYIAVPAAMRIAVPEARPNLSIAASLGITFPFNVLIGLPVYYWLARTLIGS